MEHATYTPTQAHSWQGFPVVELLRARHTAETLAFLSERPLNTVGMAGFILQNGMESSLNRGEFYGCRNVLGGLEGVALIGHATLFDARTERALSALAREARDCQSKYLIMGERDEAMLFWNYMTAGAESPRLVCHTTLMEMELPAKDFGSAPDLRVAKQEHLDLIIKANAEIILKEHGTDPLKRDPEGFRRRCARRIENGRTLVWTDKGRLLFKADVIAETPAVTYVEGVYVCPEEQGRGYGRKGMSQLAKTLACRTKAICGLVDKENADATSFYERMGYRAAVDFTTFFLKDSPD